MFGYPNTQCRIGVVMRLAVVLWLLPVSSLYAMDLPQLTHKFRCGLQTELSSEAEFLYDGFFQCSTVEQAIDFEASTNYKIVKDSSGYSYISPIDDEDDAVIIVNIKKEYNKYIFFPRVSPESSVSVSEADDDTSLLFNIEGDTSWTPIGRRYIIDLYCGKYGYLKKQFDMKLRIILRGKFAQLWLPAGQVFFR